jgi:hypothetical protein
MSEKYSQQDEERFILAALESPTTVEQRGPRRLIDIGAWHATDKSNSRALIERGWSGILVEPSPGPFVNLLRACSVCADTPPEAHGDRKEPPCRACGAVRYGFLDRVTLILAAVGLETGLTSMQASDDAVSTSDAAAYTKWEKVGGFYGCYLIPTLTPAEIFHRFGGDFAFINVDTEGTSVDIFREILKIGVHPECWCVEHDGRLVEIGQLAAEHNYNLVYTNDTNTVLEVKR